MWIVSDNLKEFKHGQEAYEEAAEIASECTHFAPDCEEEWATDEKISCYNCRYRRWTAKSFTCCKG
jgi:hypothetical protein